jgi:hypothetical protein
MSEAPRWRRIIDSLPTRRTCDGCDLCCTAVGVGELSKAPGERCQHLCGEPGRSCGLYPDHPVSCQEFVCLWRGSETALPPELHPPRCGFVVAFNGLESWPLMFTVHPDPARPMAWNTLANRTLFMDWAAKLNCMVVIGQASCAVAAFSPARRIYKRKDWPALFIDDGRTVGIPEDDFLLWRPTMRQIADAVFPGAMLVPVAR